MIAGIDNNKNVNNIVNELFIKIPNKTELERLAFNHSSHMDFKDFMNLDKKWTANHIFFSY